MTDGSVIESETVKTPWVWWNKYRHLFYEWRNHLRPDLPVVYIRALDPDHDTPNQPAGEKEDEEPKVAESASKEKSDREVKS